MTSVDEVILGVILDNNAYHHLKSSSDILLTIVDAGLDARLAIAIFFITAIARLVSLRFANTRLHVWDAATDIIWTGVVVHAVVVLLRIFAEIFQIHLWPDEIRVNAHAFIWVLLLTFLPLWIVALFRWITVHQPGQLPAISNKGKTAP